MQLCPQCFLILALEGVAKCPRCRADQRAEPARRLIDGRYMSEGIIGEGAMGVVHVARDVTLGRRVALKMIAPAQCADVEAVESFQREAMALATVRHDHVVQVYTLGMHQGGLFIAMEYVDGRNLESIVDKHNSLKMLLPRHRALSVLNQIARGLAAVHGAGMVHRDVKPANIVIENGTGRPVLVDFGLVSAAGPTELSRTGHLMGSPGYMAPELIQPGRFGDVSARTDVYALGCTAYEVLTGRLPFDFESTEEVLLHQISSPPPPLSALRPELASLDSVIARAMAKRPADRYESCTAFAAMLENVMLSGRHESQPTLPASVPPEAVDAPAARPAAVRVLVVDDDPAFARLAARAVQLAFIDTSVQVASARSGEDGLDKARRKRPDMLLLDLNLPGLSGAEMLSQLRNESGGADITVLVISGRVTEQDRSSFEMLGVEEFLAKPVDLKGLVETVDRVGTRKGWISAGSSAPRE